MPEHKTCPWVLRARLSAWLAPGVATELRYRLLPRKAYNRPAPPPQPPGSISQMIEFRDMNGDLFVLAHRFLLPGGRSTPPDPKWLWDAAAVHTLLHAAETEWCDNCPAQMRAGKTRYAAGSSQ